MLRWWGHEKSYRVLEGFVSKPNSWSSEGWDHNSKEKWKEINE